MTDDTLETLFRFAIGCSLLLGLALLCAVSAGGFWLLEMLVR